jgi:phospholipase/lecithinase/hemolysin
LISSSLVGGFASAAEAALCHVVGDSLSDGRQSADGDYDHAGDVRRLSLSATVLENPRLSARGTLGMFTK